MKQVKICGLSREADIDAVNRIRPDYCGFVVNFPKSRRSVSVERLRELCSRLDRAGPKPIGVFVNEKPETVAELLTSGVLYGAQLHGAEDGVYLRDLRKRISSADSANEHPIWQAFQIHTASDVARAASSEADFVLLDAGQGAGVSFDWSLLDNFPRPFGLAGGLRLQNLPKAMETAAVLLDVSGGVETNGWKDEAKMEEFVKFARIHPN